MGEIGVRERVCVCVCVCVCLSMFECYADSGGLSVCAPLYA